MAVRSALLDIVAGLKNKPCWGALAGGCTGSRFNLEFGELVRRPQAVQNTALPPINREFYGEYGLQVGCAAWRLDGPGGIVTAWTADCSPDGPMVKGLQQLVGTTVTKAEVLTRCLDLLIEFDQVYELRVFCDQLSSDNYTVSYQQRYVRVGSESE